MLVEQFNLYSLLVPFFLFGLSTMILVIRFFHKIPTYFMWYAYASLFAGLSLFILNIFNPKILSDFSFIPISFLLFACALLSHAVSLRLRLHNHWPFMLAIIAINAILYTYYTHVHELYTVSVLVMTMAIFLIFSHNFKAMFSKSFPIKLDRWLRRSIVLVVAITIFRALYLFMIFGADNNILANQAVSASSQFIVLFLIVIIVILLYGASYQDVITRLSYERNTDPLTGLLNRRAIFEYLQKMEYDVPHQHAVILCDIDHFKNINDTYGHHIGDLALQHVTALLSNKVRYTDRVSRLGGEEFMIILKNTSKETAICIAERLRSSFEKTPFIYKDLNLSLTLSFGVSEFENYDSFDQSLQNTDLLLYQAKKLGRNKVEWQLQH